MTINPAFLKNAFVIPAKAGIQSQAVVIPDVYCIGIPDIWLLAFAGMTGRQLVSGYEHFRTVVGLRQNEVF